MSQHSIDKIFDNLDSVSVPPASEDAKAAALAKAGNTFDQAFSQTSRPKSTSNDSLLRSMFMKLFSKQPLGPAFSYTFAAIAIVVVTTPIIVTYYSQSPIAVSETQLPLEESASLEEVVVSANRVANQDLTVTAKPERPEAIVSSPPAITERERISNDPYAPVGDMEQFAPTANKKVRVVATKQSAISNELDNDSVFSDQPRPDAHEEYTHYQRNTIKQVSQHPVSTFSADVDTASYSLVRNQLTRGYLPAQHAVRPEEFINYFDYNYPLAESLDQPFKPTVTVLESPWNADKKLLHIGIRGYDLPTSSVPDSNIVFLVDVSGSMSDHNKLPLAKQSIAFLLTQLKADDKVSIVVYAGAAGTVLEPTEAKDKSKIMNALNRLQSGGSTAGGAGIRLAYDLAQQNFNKDAINRVVMLTDGDFNVGQSSNQELLELIERKRKSGVFLSVLGFGRFNYQDDMMQTLAQNGNGVASYIDTLSEAKKVMVDEAQSSLFPIAKDVKFQIEFNPSTVSDYRLIGYETRHLNNEDFNNDKVDAGDIGAGHSVTAIYEITPRRSATQSVDKPRYAQNQAAIDPHTNSNEYGYLKIRFKSPNEDISRLIESPILIESAAASKDVKFSVAVAGFAQLLSGSNQVGELSYQDVIKLAKANKGNDEYGYRAEFIQLVEMADLIE